MPSPQALSGPSGVRWAWWWTSGGRTRAAGAPARLLPQRGGVDDGGAARHPTSPDGRAASRVSASSRFWLCTVDLEQALHTWLCGLLCHPRGLSSPGAWCSVLCVAGTLRLQASGPGLLRLPSGREPCLPNAPSVTAQDPLDMARHAPGHPSRDPPTNAVHRMVRLSGGTLPACLGTQVPTGTEEGRAGEAGRGAGSVRLAGQRPQPHRSTVERMRASVTVTVGVAPLAGLTVSTSVLPGVKRGHHRTSLGVPGCWVLGPPAPHCGHDTPVLKQ